MGSKRTPPPPDYTGAAQAQAQASRENLNTQNFANRPNINTPFGSESWTTRAVTDPATGQQVTEWTQNTSLDPRLQNALDSQIGIQQGRSDLANAFMGRVQDEYRQPFDWNSLPALTSAGTPGQLQTGVADYTPGLQTGVGPRGVVSGFNFGGPQMGVGSMSDSVQRGIGQTGLVGGVDPGTAGLATGTAQTPVQSGFDAMLGGLQRGVSPTSVNTGFGSFGGGLATRTGTEQVQRGLATGDNPALPQIDNTFRDRVATDLMTAMLPAQQLAQQSLETDLSNRGFKVGTRGYQRALDDLGGRQAAERYNALGQAGQEAQRLFGMQMGARQQAFNEDVSGGQFANQAANQAFGQGLAANQFQNQAVGQAFNQDVTARQAQNQAFGQQFNQALAAGQFGNQATQQAYAQALGATEAANRAAAQQFQQGLAGNQFRNQALGQAFNQNMGAAQFANQAADQRFNQGLAAGNFANQATQQAFNQDVGAGRFGNEAQAQYFGQMMGQADLANRAGQQAFSQDLAAGQFGNQAMNQAQNLDINRMQAMNQAQQQQFGQNMQYANMMNQLRQQAIAEQQQRRGMSLNEMNALLTGQQVGMPQMPRFNASGIAETPQLLNAANMQYQAGMDAFNAQQQGMANTMGGLSSLASTAFMFSDRRLKRRVKRVGTHADLGVGIYEYEMAGFAQRGVIAQEVAAVRPDLVKRHASGYLMVDYGRVAA
jgi:hypothetical protein